MCYLLLQLEADSIASSPSGARVSKFHGNPAKVSKQLGHGGHDFRCPSIGLNAPSKSGIGCKDFLKEVPFAK